MTTPARTILIVALIIISAGCSATVSSPSQPGDKIDVGINLTDSAYQAVSFSSDDVVIARGQALELSTTNPTLSGLGGWQWYVDGVEDTSQTSSSFHWDTSGVPPGQYIVSTAVVFEGVMYSGSLRVTVTY